MPLPIQPDKQDKDYDEILRTCAILLETAVGGGAKGLRHADAIHLFKKLIFHCATARRLLQPTTIQGMAHMDFVDFASLASIARCAAESTLVFQHIFGCTEVGEDQQLFRHAAWRLEGYLSREKMVEHRDILATQLAENQKQIDNWTSQLKSTAAFAALPERLQKCALKGDWRGAMVSTAQDRKLKWTDIAVAAGLSPVFAEKLYSYQSQFVHTTSVSVFQVGEAGPETREELARLSLIHLAALMAFMAKRFTDFYPPTAWLIKSSTNPELFRMLELYYDIATR